MPNQDEDFEALLQESFRDDKTRGSRKLAAGQVVEGTIIDISADLVFVDVGGRSEARLERHEITDSKGELRLKVGDKIRATVTEPNAPGGPVLVLALGRDGSMATRDLELARDGGTPVEGIVQKVIKGGLEIQIGNVRAFCPASQVDLAYASDLETYVGQAHFFKVMEVRDRGRSVVVSRRALLEAERERSAEDRLKSISVGAVVDGIVQGIQPYGVFVDLGGIQGLVHVSELAHHRVSRPDDVVSIGEPLRVQVLAIEMPTSGKPGDAKISLSLKAITQPDTPTTAASEQSDDQITATVVKVESFGVIVDTKIGRGMVPTRELSLPTDADPRRHLHPGDTMEVVRMAGGGDKLRFSVRGVDEAEARRNYRDFTKAKASNALGSLGDLLRDKIQASPSASAPKRRNVR